MQTLLADSSGVINIADDILVFVSTVVGHDLILQKVFQRLSEKGLRKLFSKKEDKTKG